MDQPLQNQSQANRNLRNNELNGCIPTNISLLSRLRTLYLDQNNLSGIIPEKLCYLSHLEELFAILTSITTTRFATAITVEHTERCLTTHASRARSRLRAARRSAASESSFFPSAASSAESPKRSPASASSLCCLPPSPPRILMVPFIYGLGVICTTETCHTTRSVAPCRTCLGLKTSPSCLFNLVQHKNKHKHKHENKHKQGREPQQGY